MLGEKIKELRKKNNISQEELAEELKVSRQSVSLWENDQTLPSLDKIVAIAKFFNVSTDSLLETDVEHEKEAPRIDFKKKSTPKKLVLLFSIIGVLLIISTVVICYYVSRPFSKNTAAMAKAENSVVKIYCYDANGNECATGSGFIAYEENICITNYHVLTDAYSYKISTHEDRTLNVKSVIASSENRDIAVVELEKNTALKPLPLGNSDEIKKGETVTAIGSPLGLKNTLTQGVLSGRLMQDNMDILQISAPISSGSSGGALFNENGEVVGVTFASYEEGQNLNLAIPINEVKEFIDGYNLSNGGTREPNCIFLDNHIGYEYIAQYSDTDLVTIEMLKNNPKQYDGKIIKLQATVSSIKMPDGELSFITGEENYSGDRDYDWNSYIATHFENSPLVYIFKDHECKYSQKNLTAGDTVTVVGKFKYRDIGDEYRGIENDEIVSLKAEITFGEIRPLVIYYE